MITAKLSSASCGGSAASDFTVYPNDDRRFWKTCRKELVKAGFTSEVLEQGNRKKLIMAYVVKLCETGAFDGGASQVSLGIYGEEKNVQDLSSPAPSFLKGNSVNIPRPNEQEPIEMREVDPATQYLMENAILVQPPKQPRDSTASGLSCKGKKRPRRKNDASDKEVNPASKSKYQAPSTNAVSTPPTAPTSSPLTKPRTPNSGASSTDIKSAISKASSLPPLTKASPRVDSLMKKISKDKNITHIRVIEEGKKTWNAAGIHIGEFTRYGRSGRVVGLDARHFISLLVRSSYAGIETMY